MSGLSEGWAVAIEVIKTGLAILGAGLVFLVTLAWRSKASKDYVDAEIEKIGRDTLDAKEQADSKMKEAKYYAEAFVRSSMDAFLLLDAKNDDLRIAPLVTDLRLFREHSKDEWAHINSQLEAIYRKLDK